MDFFDTLLRPDHEDDPQGGEIAHAANLLQVGEFQLLQLAHAEWFGREMTLEETSRYFRLFMIERTVPGWALRYARDIAELDRQGRLDDRREHYHRYDCDYSRRPMSNGMRRFIVAATLVTGVVGGGLAMATYSADCNGGILPPCFERGVIP